MKPSEAPVYLQDVDGWISLTANEPGYGTEIHYYYGELDNIVTVSIPPTGHTSPMTGHISKANT